MIDLKGVREAYCSVSSARNGTDGGQEQQEEEEGGGLVDGVGNATLGPVRWEAPESLKRNHFRSGEKRWHWMIYVCLSGVRRTDGDMAG